MKQNPVISDQNHITSPDVIKMQGLIGKRFEASRINRLQRQEDYHLLWPFVEHHPSAFVTRRSIAKQTPPEIYRGDKPDEIGPMLIVKQPHPEISRADWQGEFVGLYLDAACISAWYAGDKNLRNKVDGIVNELLLNQQEDGYLGTFEERDRWESFDVWIQANVILGLMSYYRFTGDERVLDASIRIADRVLQDFGPGKRSFHNVGWNNNYSQHIEALIWLYWETGNTKYLEFARWIADDDWEAPGGPQIISALNSGLGVAKAGGGKGAEMVICYTCLVELFRATGEEKYLKSALIAWDDIVQHHLYITGSASTGEFFQENHILRNDGIYYLGETCVTMSWMYFNLSLAKLTGEARFYDMVEQTLYNHLLGAQSADGKGWVYYMGLRDSKRYRWHTDPDCCPSRGIRALAQMPLHIINTKDDGIVVNFYEALTGKLNLPAGQEVEVKIQTLYPYEGDVEVSLNLKAPIQFKVYLRIPGWCKEWQIDLNGKPQQGKVDEKGYLVIDRVWTTGDRIELKMDMPAKVIIDEFGNNGHVTIIRGPLVYAADSHYLPERYLLDDVILSLNPQNPAEGIKIVKEKENGSVHLVVPSVKIKPNRGQGAWKEKERYYYLQGGKEPSEEVSIELVPFFEAGNHDPDSYKKGVWSNEEPIKKITYKVWLPYTFKD